MCFSRFRDVLVRLVSLGKLQVRGVDPGQASRMQQSWKLVPGAVYDPIYVQEFVKDVSRFLPPRPAAIRKVESINDEQKTVDVLIEIRPTA